MSLSPKPHTHTHTQFKGYFSTFVSQALVCIQVHVLGHMHISMRGYTTYLSIIHIYNTDLILAMKTALPQCGKGGELSASATVSGSVPKKT